jgi:hypothetical protein
MPEAFLLQWTLPDKETVCCAGKPRAPDKGTKFSFIYLKAKAFHRQETYDFLMVFL